MKVFFLSAGPGIRLKPLTNDKPKVMIRIGDKPVLEHLINLCKHHKFTEIIITLNHFPDVITSYFGNGKKFNVNIQYSYEEKMMGGAGALKYAQKLIKNDHFFVLNADVITNINLTDIADFHKSKKGIGTFLVHHTDHPYDSDIVEYNENKLVKKFFRPQLGDKFKEISKSGTHIFKPEVLDFIPEGREYSLEKQLIPDLLKKGKKLYAYYSDCYSKDMGTLKRLEQVQKDYKQGKINYEEVS